MVGHISPGPIMVGIVMWPNKIQWEAKEEKESRRDGKTKVVRKREKLRDKDIDRERQGEGELWDRKGNR